MRNAKLRWRRRMRSRAWRRRDEARAAEHLLRAAATIAGVSDLVVIGSQAILGSYPEWRLPDEATRSVEADIAVDAELARLDLVIDESELADTIDGAIGEGSVFHGTFGYYAQGVETTTAVLPDGWRGRLVPVICEAADPVVVGWCLERHDLWVAKAVANREKDREFCRSLARAGLIDRAVCTARIAGLAASDRARAQSVERHAFR